MLSLLDIIIVHAITAIQMTHKIKWLAAKQIRAAINAKTNIIAYMIYSL